ncbi:mechanosensitive ion channel family protein [Massilia forsythiae]|uniref:Small-conductance mechanosensitive channel n=1 Tax=Massilia forsythiae TaxID=2728020 RepID=A0A7Z2W030_9BURK|nr:mechanosensitive ion channel family protein [Massilia forsythiae]QJE02597.1 mechanosensitive ion channel family protein [Massilia forsythiae]
MSEEIAIAYQRMHAIGISAMRLLPNVVIAVVVMLLFVLIARWTRSLVERLSARKYHQNLVLVLGRMAQWGLYLMGLLLAMTIAFPSFTPGNLISALGITGIAIGFAFKDIFENFLAGILILVGEPFRIGDQIVFGNFEGTIEQIETRATKMRTYDGRLVIIPNADLYKGTFIVNTAYPTRRLQYDVVIGNGDDIGAAKRLMREAMADVSEVEQDPAPDVLLLNYADAGVTLRMRWWIRPPRRADALAVQDQVLERVKAALAENGIDLPYPTRQVLLHDQTEETDGDRRRQREGWPAGKSEVPAPARTRRPQLYDGASGDASGDGERADGTAASA